MNYVVQTKPDELTEVSESFKRQEEAVGEMRQNLAQMNDRLKQGWIGLGSEAYFAESESLVLPAVQRLADALGEASRLVKTITDRFDEADHQASSPFKEEQTGSGSNAAAAQGGQAAGAGAQQAGGAGGGQLGSRLQSAGFGAGAQDLQSRGADLGRTVPPHAAMSDPKSFLSNFRNADPFRAATTPFSRAGTEFGSAFGEGLGTSSGFGGGSGGGGTGGGGGGLGSVLGALRGQAGEGFGLGGTASGGAPSLTYSGLGGFGGSGGLRPPNFAIPIAIAAASPFAALLGKVVKDRTQNN